MAKPENQFNEGISKQCENNVNRWTQELLEQEKDFIAKATSLNDWDKIIKDSGNSLNAICQTVKNVRVSQKQIIDDLDFIKTQQAELEKVISSLEKEMETAQNLKHSDQRAKLYDLADSLDSSSKRVSEDLKEVVETINEETMRGFNPNDPILQIRRVLNANLNNLRWIDDYSRKIKTVCENIAKEKEEKLKEQEIKSSTS